MTPSSYIRGMINLAMNDAMNLAINDHRLAKPGQLNAALRDYDSVRRAIAANASPAAGRRSRVSTQRETVAGGMTRLIGP